MRTVPVWVLLAAGCGIVEATPPSADTSAPAVSVTLTLDDAWPGLESEVHVDVPDTVPPGTEVRLYITHQGLDDSCTADDCLRLAYPIPFAVREVVRPGVLDRRVYLTVPTLLGEGDTLSVQALVETDGAVLATPVASHTIGA
jgi:hypothetical protein